MRNTDPFDFFHDHRDAIFRWLGITGAALVVFLILRFWAMRKGGWKAAWRWVCREIAITANAFAAPVRAWLRHRRDLRTLVRLLRDTSTWRDAERALAAARIAAAPARPYAAIVGDVTVTVLLAGANIPAPKDIWWVDPGEDGQLWTAAREDLPSATPEAEGVRPIVVATGTAERRCAFLDLSVGPAMVAVDGDRRSRSVVLRALAAQVDARLPEPLVVVADGVHPAFRGGPVRDAYRTARHIPARLGIPPVLVAAELPDPLPVDLDAPGLRVLVLGSGRGHVRSLLTDGLGQLSVVGTPLVVRSTALGLAIARILPRIPTVLPPVPAATSTAGLANIELFEEEHATLTAPSAARNASEAPSTANAASRGGTSGFRAGADEWREFEETGVGVTAAARTRGPASAGESSTVPRAEPVMSARAVAATPGEAETAPRGVVGGSPTREGRGASPEAPTSTGPSRSARP